MTIKTLEEALAATTALQLQADALAEYLRNLQQGVPTARPEPVKAKGLTNAPAFYDALRGRLWPRLSESVVQGLERLTKAGAGVLPLSWMADLLGQVYHEGAYTMQPITERGSNEYLDKYDTGRLAAALGNTPDDDDDGQFWRGRGDIMITGKRNYTVANTRLHELGVLIPQESLLTNPELALRPDVSAAIAVYGMLEGWFTGKRFKDYLPGQGAGLNQHIEARRIVNGTDRAHDIAGYSMIFQRGLELGGWQ